MISSYKEEKMSCDTCCRTIYKKRSNVLESDESTTEMIMTESPINTKRVVYYRILRFGTSAEIHCCPECLNDVIATLMKENKEIGITKKEVMCHFTDLNLKEMEDL